MSASLHNDEYRGIVVAYFQAFGTRDFAPVRFSAKIEFLSPISGTTMKGRDEVVRFLNGVCSRVSAVGILSTCVDPS